MKRIAFTILLSLGCGIFYAAVPEKPAVATNFSRTEIAIEQLPEGVQKTLEGARFTGWKPILAYKVTSGTSEYFEITFVRGDEIEQLLLNRQGGKIG